MNKFYTLSDRSILSRFFELVSPPAMNEKVGEKSVIIEINNHHELKLHVRGIRWEFCTKHAQTNITHNSVSANGKTNKRKKVLKP